LGLEFHNVQASRAGTDVGLLSNALEKFNNIVSIFAPASRCRENSSIVVRS